MRRLTALRRPQIAERLSEQSILVLPVGSIEQHGPHLPFDTDLAIAARTAEAAVERFGDDLDLWLLPALPYSKSNEHARAPGTVWLSARTLLSVIEDLGASLASLPARRLVLLNGHGGNSALLNVACRELRIAHGLLTFLAHPMLPPDQGGSSPDAEQGMGIHGGHAETSLMMYLRPESVGDVPGPNVPLRLAGNRHVRFGGPVSFGWTADDFGAEGHIGDPTGASAAEGARLFQAIVEGLGEALREVREFALGV